MTTTDADDTAASLLDVNVMIALTQPDHLHHRAARAWWRARTDRPWATCGIVEAGFVRLMTNPVVAGRDEGLPTVLDTLRRLRALPRHRFVADTSSLADAVIDLTGLRGHQQVMDFHLVNLAVVSGTVLATFDRRIPEALAPEDRRHVDVISPA